MQDDNKILRIFGDSLLKGIVYDAHRERYTLLEDNGLQKIEHSLSLKVDSKAMFGCTVTKGRALLERSIVKSAPPTLVLIEFGGNDCDYLWDEVSANPELDHLPKTPLTLFSKTLKAMLRMVESLKAIPVLMNLPPIDGELYFKHICKKGGNGEQILKWLKEVHNIEAVQQRYSDEIVKIARETQTRLIDVRGAFSGKQDFLCQDGIHLNAWGHNLMIETLIAPLIA
ncbi:MAG: SGNH/GDSL hydrolase family protein [Sphaerochaetaceae bacterium]